MLPFRVIQLEQYRVPQRDAARLCHPEFRYSELSLVAQSSSGPKLSRLNRQIPELKRRVTYRKQTTATCSNRQKIQKRLRPISRSTSLSSARDFTSSQSQNAACLMRGIGPFFQSGCTTSNRFWTENRCYRKQMIKPCLTGARTVIKEFQKPLKMDPIFDVFFAPISDAKSEGTA
jgi:hypothetical protein